MSGLPIPDDAEPSDAPADAGAFSLEDSAQVSPDLPMSPDLPPAYPDLPPLHLDLPPGDPTQPSDPLALTDGSGDPPRFYERPDVFTHEVRALDGGESIDSSPASVDLATSPDMRPGDAAPTIPDARPIDGGPRMVEYPLPTKDCSPQAIAAGPDGNLWFTEACNRIGRITTGGVISEFLLPNANRFPGTIIAGPDGNLWFVEDYGDRIGRITPAGTITEYLVPTVDSVLSDIVVGPDGNLWFVEEMGNQIGRMTMTGEFAEFVVPPETVWPWQIAAGPDGNLWFASNGIALGRISTAGTITPVFLPFDLGNSNIPTDIVTGPDGNFWIGLWHSNTRITSLVRLTLDGATTEFPLPGVNNSMQQIVVGPDGNLWLTLADNRIGRFTLQGELTTFSTSQPYTYPQGICVGPDGNIWFTATSGNLVGRIIP
jgi:streptogramin lyase